MLPYESEAASHVDLRYGETAAAKRGNFIPPMAEMWHPRVSVRSCDPEKLYSVVLIDADAPLEGVDRRVQLCLWAK